VTSASTTKPSAVLQTVGEIHFQPSSLTISVIAAAGPPTVCQLSLPSILATAAFIHACCSLCLEAKPSQTAAAHAKITAAQASALGSTL
jgi:hypothetical protein